MMTDPRQRASDADRQRVVAALERHTAAGRLTLGEYAERVDSVLAARTHGELGAVTDDLPADADRSGDQRHLLVVFLVAALVVGAFAVILGLAR
jgi:Domain of unknown function (DUF1707)